MRASEDVYVEWVGDEAVALHRRSGELHYLNATAAIVLALIQEHGYDAGVAEVVGRFGLDPADDGLRALLDDLAVTGIVEGPRGEAVEAHVPDVREPRAAPG